MSSSSLEAAPCPRHPERAASFACSSCGKAICVDCGGEREGKRYCEGCLASSFERAAAIEARRSQGMSGVTAGVIALVAIASVLGLFWLVAQPSIERAKEKSRWRMCETGLDKVFDAARLYAEDHGRALPRGTDGTTEGLVRFLVETGYLRDAPKSVTAGTVALGQPTLDGDPMAPYVVDDAAHGVPPDLKRHVLRLDGTVSRMTEADWAVERAKSVTATASFAAPVVATGTAGGK